jgi:hypothetical protein
VGTKRVPPPPPSLAAYLADLERKRDESPS